MSCVAKAKQISHRLPSSGALNISNYPLMLPSLPPKILSNLSISQTKEAHALLILSGCAHDSPFLARLLSSLALSRSPPLHYSLSIYHTIHNPSVFASNNMIRCFAKSESPLGSLSLYSSVLRSWVRPNNYTFPFLLQACAKGFGLLEGVQVHGHVVKFGYLEDVYVRNALIHFYSGCCEVESARKVFYESPERSDVVSWNVMLAGLARAGRVGDVEKMFDAMPERDVVSWSTMIMGYVHNGRLEEGLECFRRMREHGVVPNEAMLVTVLSASAQLGLLEQGRWIHGIVDLLNLPMTVTIGTALVDMYAKCGYIELSRSLFDKMPLRDVSTWNVMICGLASHGFGKEVLVLFERFLDNGFNPDNVTFVGVLNACSRAGMVREGKHYFKLMTDRYGIEPEMEHYGCMVDLLGRAGLVSEAIEMIENRVLSPDPVLWATLLCACRIHGFVELGEKVGSRLIQVDPTYDGHYVQLASIYAKSRKWEDVIRVRRLMAERHGSKLAGWSLIEAQGRVHRFIVGDREHEHSSDIHKMLDMIETCLAEAGYVPNLSSILHDIGEEEKENAIKVHSERLAIAFGFLVTKPGDCIRIVKNLRVCGDCHEMTKLTSRVFRREIIVRDGSRFHHFKEGKCSCGDFW